MPVKIAEAALRIRATGVDEARGKILKLGSTIQSAMRTPAGSERALAPLRQRIDLLAQAAKQEGTKAEALAKLQGMETGLDRALGRSNLSMAQRVKLEEQLRRVQAARAAAVPVAPVPIMRTPAVFGKADDSATGRRIALLAEGIKLEGTRTASLVKLAGVEAGLTRALERGNLTLAQRVRLEGQLRRVQSLRSPTPVPPVPPAGGGIGVRGVLAGTLGALGITAGIGAAAAGFRAMGDASDSAEAAQRKLTATSRLTGVALGAVGTIAATAGDRFKLGERQAADLTAEVVKLTTRANQSGRSVEFMSSWLDLASANGQTLDDALQGLTTTLAGQDEGLNRLGLRNPTQIWASWGKEIGKTVAQMTDAEKWQAIVNEVVTQGAKVQGTYAIALESTAGRQQQLGKAAEDTAKIYGRALAPIRETLIAGARGTLEWFGANISLMQSIGAAALAGTLVWSVVKLAGAVRALSFASLTLTALNPVVLGIAAVAAAVGGLVWVMGTAKRESAELRDELAKLSGAEQTAKQIALTKERIALQAKLNREKRGEHSIAPQSASQLDRQDRVNAAGGSATQRRIREIDKELAALAQLQQARDAVASAGATPPASAPGAGDGGGPTTAEKDATVSLIGALERLHAARNLTAAEWAQVAELERTLTAQRDALAAKTGQSAAATIALAEAEQRLASVRAISDVSAPVITPITPELLPLPDVNLWKIKPVALTVPVTVTPDVDVRLEAVTQAVDTQFASLTGNIAGVLGESLGAAFSGGMGDAGDVLLSGLGSIMQQMGQSLLTFGATMMGLLPALTNPFTSGPAALIAGAALIAIGGVLSGIAGGGGSRGGAGGSGIVAFDDRTERVGLGTGRVTAPVSGVVQPSGSSAGAAIGRVASAPTPINMPIFAVNPADPATQRLVNETMTRAGRRNL